MHTSHFDMQDIYKKDVLKGCDIVRLVHLWHQQGHLKVKRIDFFLLWCVFCFCVFIKTFFRAILGLQQN